MLELHASVNRLQPIKLALTGLTAIALSGCAANSPSHVPNPVLLPAYAVGNAIQNANYNSRRSKVKSHLTKNFDAIQQEIFNGGGPALLKGYDLAHVPANRRPALTAMLKKEPNLRIDSEALTVSLMVHGD